MTAVTIPGIGKVLAFGNRVLYVHMGDTKNHSTCTGVCATAWPPLLVPSKAAHHLGHVHGLGTFRRSKGHLQVTMKGHPLYFFIGDKTKTSAKGQGFANVFFTVRPNGTVVHVTPAASPVAPSPTSTSSTSSTPSTQASHGTQPPPATVPTSPPTTHPPATTTTSPPTTTTTSPPTTTTTAPGGGGVAF